MLTVRPCSFRCWLLLSCLAAFGSACGHEIGDSCTTSLDCSQQNSRICDRTQSGGYCTIAPCERGTCPEEATCVEFRPAEDRLALTYCMRKCSSDSDCRDDEGYRCRSAQEFSSCQEAATLDGPGQRFCAHVPAALPLDAGVSPARMCMNPGGS